MDTTSPAANAAFGCAVEDLFGQPAAAADPVGDVPGCRPAAGGAESVR